MAQLRWAEHGVRQTARWHSENGTPTPARVIVIDDATNANAALRLVAPDTVLLWRGDFENAKHLLKAMDRRLHARASRNTPAHDADLGRLFAAHRAERAERAELLGRVVVALESDYTIQLRRAPDVRDACTHAYGPANTGDAPEATLVSLSELIGVIGAYQWHRTGIEVPALGARITPAYGVFTPTRDEYLDLVLEAPFPESAPHPVVFDIGTGTGVLAALIARRGARSVLATDINPRAVRCATANVQQLDLTAHVTVVEADLWPADPALRADVIVCNPPWLPGAPTSDLELGIYDPASEVLHRFLDGLADRLTPGGEGWLILSDLAEILGLRSREEFVSRIAEAGLEVLGTHETAPRHTRARDTSDPLHAARSRERTLLWRLAPRATHVAASPR